MTPNDIFSLQQALIELLEAFNKLVFNIELEAIESGLKGFYLLFDILKSSSLKALGIIL